MTETTPVSPGSSYRVGESISYGWAAYLKNIGPMVLITLVIIAIQALVSLLTSSLIESNDTNIGFVIAQLIVWVVGIVLAMGLIRASIAVTEGRTPTVSMLFETAGFGNYLVAAVLFGIAVFVGFILFIIPGIIVAVIFMFHGYTIVQNPNTSPIDALKRSAEITKGYRWPLFGLGILLVLINIVGLILCFIGLLFTYGITAIAIAHAYKRLSGQAISPVV